MAAERPAPETLTREELLRENARLREELARLGHDRRQVERERDRLQRRHDQLKEQLDAARRAGYRQAAPFAKPTRHGTGRRAGRRAGVRYGRRGHRPRPSTVDEAHTAALPATCPDCGGGVTPSHVATQYQEDVPVARPIVRAVHVHVGTCQVCGRRVQGRHPVQTSDAFGAAAAHLGPHVSTLIVWWHTGLGLPLGKVQRMLRTQYGRAVTRGGLAQVCARVASRAAPT